jgi:molybdenum cofactor cytidylyltransferase
MVSIVLLCAGLSRRMGKVNKLLLPFRESTILETTLNQLIAVKCGELIAVTGHESDKIKAILEEKPLKIVENPKYESGMTSSIQVGVSNTDSVTKGYMICLADMPLIKTEEYQALLDFFEKCLMEDTQTIVQPIYKGTKGNPVLLSSFYKNEILENTESDGCRPIVMRNKGHLRFLEMEEGNILRDVDVEEEYLDLVKSNYKKIKPN